ncbi:hypothetical protein yaldo0001_2400 [Yersinia aldovae ATCC 35236]|nr:hypothetical protein yaldo0001_2400 [Yersinia aldovae ATCC 35236]
MQEGGKRMTNWLQTILNGACAGPQGEPLMRLIIPNHLHQLSDSGD